MIDATFVQEIVSNAKPITPQERIHEITDAHGKTAQFTDMPLKQIEAKAPELPPVVKVFTLGGLGDLIEDKLDNRDHASEFLLHVAGPTKVDLVQRVADEYGRRLVLAAAEPVEYDRFPFGKFLPQEEFIIQFASRFSPAGTTDYKYVIDIASSVTENAARTATDNGLAQTTTLKRGMQVPKEDVNIKPRVSLAPYRIFPECNQPVSDFLFRLQGGDDHNTPKLALFEADGGQWKIAAINEVRRYLATLDLGVPIIA